LNAEEVRGPALDKTDKIMIDTSRDRKAEADVGTEDMKREIVEIIKIKLIDHSDNRY
jgi:hypothetical protein